MPSTVRPKGSNSGGRAPPVTPMSERQQMALLMQMTSPSNQIGSRSPSGANSSRSRDRNERGETPLHLAAIKGDVEQVSRLLAHRTDPNVADFAGWTPLHEACNHGWYEVACRLVQAGANINARGLDDDTPLHDAAANGHVKLVRYLIERGADISIKNKKGKTPCDVAKPSVLPYLLDSTLPFTESSAGQRVQSRPRDEKKLPADPSGKKSTIAPAQAPMDPLDPPQPPPKSSGSTSSINSTSTTLAASNLNTNTSNTTADDIYEFKSKESSSNTKNPTLDSSKTDNEPQKEPDPTTTPASTDDTSTNAPKRTFGEANEVDEVPDDETRRKKRKDSDTNKIGPQQNRTQAQSAKIANKPGTVKSAPQASERKSPCPSPKPADSELDDAKPDLKVPPLKIVIPQSNTAGEVEPGGNRNGKSSSQRAHHAALPYVVPSSNEGTTGGAGAVGSDKEQVAGAATNPSPVEGGPGGQTTVPAVGQATPGKDDKKDNVGSVGEDQKTSGHHQRVLRSSHRSAGTSGNTLSASGPPAASATATDRSSNNSSPLMQRSHSPSPNASPAAPVTTSATVGSGVQAPGSVQANTLLHSVDANRDNSTGTSGTQPSGSNAKSSTANSDTQISTNADTDSSGSNTTTTSTSAATTGGNNPNNNNNAGGSSSGGSGQNVELHPRKRKMRPNKDPSGATSTATGPHNDGSGSSSSSSTSSNNGGNTNGNTANSGTDSVTAAEIHPHEQPITNCYQLYLNIRKQIERRRKSLFPVQPKPPQGFKDYLMNRCTYVLAGTAPTVPNVTPPASLPVQMRDLFSEQERERYRLRMQHVIEKEKLVLSVEQEILRVHGRAARALANQSLPFSVCTVLRDDEVYNIITPEQEEKDRNARSRYNGRLFLSWLQDVDDKWEKIKEHMLLRHHNEAESLHAVQRMDWEWKLKEVLLCEYKVTPHIDDVHVPMVHVSDDFDLLPA